MLFGRYRWLNDNLSSGTPPKTSGLSSWRAKGESPFSLHSPTRGPSTSRREMSVRITPSSSPQAYSDTMNPGYIPASNGTSTLHICSTPHSYPNSPLSSTTSGHYVENTGNTTLRFLEIFNSGTPSSASGGPCPPTDVPCLSHRQIRGRQSHPMVGTDSASRRQGSPRRFR